MRSVRPAWLVGLAALATSCAGPVAVEEYGLPAAREYHVSLQGSDKKSGSAASPFRTISAAAKAAQPGEAIVVHEGTYRERISPPRGGTSDTTRITYRAAEGEMVIIKGSEVVTGWKRTPKGVWKVTLPDSFFGDYNPYTDVIKGDWFAARGRAHHTGEVYLDGAALYEEVSLDRTAARKMSWYCETEGGSTHIWANFGDADPGGRVVEINVRPTIFYPDTPGRDYITVRGFTMRHAATQWAAPTAEQIALIGTHWSKGWIIEDCVISDSKCVGVTLGKDRASGHNNAQSAGGYNIVVKRALEAGWSREKIGSHVVRNNTIYNCGAAGICGSLGAVFSRITGNHIHHVHQNKPFGGAEMAGIKLHAAIDTLLANNRIHDTCRGIWLDWMAQGTRVTSNLLYRNGSDDLFVEVNHGPFMVDNNIFLSRTSISDWSQGGAYAYNLFAGTVRLRPQGRRTPYHKEHSTEIAGLSNISGGDDRYYNNVFAGGTGLKTYDRAKFPMHAGGNVYLRGAAPFGGETNYVQLPQFDPGIKLEEEDGVVRLSLSLPELKPGRPKLLVTTALLGKAKIPDVPYMNHDGAQLKLDRDYFGKARDVAKPFPGPFGDPGSGDVRMDVWKGRR